MLGKEVLGVGDFDGDGQVDLLTSLFRANTEISRAWPHSEGELGRSRRGGLIRRSAVSTLVGDGARLDADGVADWVFVGGDRARALGYLSNGAEA